MSQRYEKPFKCVVCGVTDPNLFKRVKSVCAAHYKQYLKDKKSTEEIYLCTYKECTEENPINFYLEDKNTCKNCHKLIRLERRNNSLNGNTNSSNNVDNDNNDNNEENETILLENSSSENSGKINKRKIVIKKKDT